MSDRPTPETDAKASPHIGFYSCATVPANFARALEQERDEAREALSDWENAALHVEADHPNEKHCGCVPVLRKLLTDALKERDEWAAMCGRYKQERDELLQKLDAWKEISELLHHFVNYPANGIHQAIQRVELLEAYKHLLNE